MDAPSIHGEEPIEQLDARRNGDEHRHDSEEGIDADACAHGEEVMEPNEEGEEGDQSQRKDHREVSKEPLLRKCRDDFRKDAKRRQDQNVDFRAGPTPK